MKHPMQKITVTETGKKIFIGNKIVEELLAFSSSKGFGLNEIAMMEFCNDDRMQFAQLIGYTLSGYGYLSYVTPENYDIALKISEGINENEAVILVLEEKLSYLKKNLADPVASLYGIHPDDLGNL